MTVLCLDGGGSKCVFQYKLLSLVLAECKDPVIDLIVGVSGGAIVGALVATGKLHSVDLESSIARFYRQRNDNGPLLAPMYDGSGKRSSILSVFGSMRMRDVDIPLAILTTKMSDGSLQIISSWEHPSVLLVDALDASSAAPIAFPPVHVPSAGGWLLDGGVLNNIPITNACLIAAEQNIENIRILSIGCTTKHVLNVDAPYAASMGILSWASRGLMDIVLNVGDDTSVRLMEAILGRQNILRITTSVKSSFEVPTRDTLNKLTDEATSIYSSKGSDLINFLSA
jgi:patatin-like phospholipase/acyl hydrolase